MTKKPDEIVAEEIINKFKTQNLIEEEKAASLLKKLAGGDFSTEDWKLIAELADDTTEGAENGETD